MKYRIMKRVIKVWVILMLISIRSYATNYYVSNTGSDTNNGSKEKPWKTIDKLNTKRFLPGDSILFRCGDVFYGELIPISEGVSNNYIVYSAYGNIANKPIINAFNKISYWTDEGNGIFSSEPLDIKPNILVIDNSLMKLGRWPNTGWLKYQASTNTSAGTTITSSQLNSNNTNWEGAEVVILRNHWNISRDKIVQHIDQTLSFNFTTFENPRIGEEYGFFIQNDRRTLDEFGEWAFSDDRLYVYFGEKNPMDFDVKISTKNYGFYARWKGFYSIENIEFSGQNLTSIFVDSWKEVTIKNCSFNCAGMDAIDVYGGLKKVVIENNDFENIQGVGIFAGRLGSNFNIEIKNNLLKNISIIEGMGRVDGKYYGLYASGENSLIQGNKIDSVGYNAISFFKDDFLVEDNVVMHSNLLLRDGGAIYTWQEDADTLADQKNMVITNNLILDCKSIGIYSDGFTNNLKIISNTIKNTRSHCIHMNEPRYNIIKNNLIIGRDNTIDDEPANTKAIIDITNHSNVSKVRAYGNIIKDNVIYTNLHKAIFRLADGTGEYVYQFGRCDSNIYIINKEYSKTLNLFVLQKNPPKWITGNYDYEYWQNNFSMDKNSKVYYKTPIIHENVSPDTLILNKNTHEINISGNNVSFPFKIKPYSIILNFQIKQDTVTSSLKKGKNIVSFGLEPLNNNPFMFFSDLIGANILIKVQDENGNTFEKSLYDNTWINNLGNIDYAKGYIILLSGNYEFKYSGYKVQFPDYINLKQGWNILPIYDNKVEKPVDFIKSSIDTNSFNVLMDANGNYIKRDINTGLWENTIGSLTPFEGYLIKVNDKVNFSYKQN